MKKSVKMLTGVALSTLLLSGCTSKLTQAEQYSGFLPSYQGLEETTSSTGEPVLRWVAPGFNPRAYSTVVFKELELYPVPKPTERVNAKTLNELQAITSANVKGALGQKYTVVPTEAQAPIGSRTLIMHAAITGVSASNEGMKWYEVVPVAAVVGATQAALGYRDQNTELFIEADLVDAASGQPVVKVVRKVLGTSIENDRQAITSNDFKAALKGLTTDLSKFIE